MFKILTNDRLKKTIQETVFLDGATSDNGRNSCMGVIIRDRSGSPIGAQSKPLPLDFSAEVTVAIALLQGILFASESRFLVPSLSETLYQ